MEYVIPNAEHMDLHQLSTLIPLNTLMESHLLELLKESALEHRFTNDLLFEAGQFDPYEYYLLNGDVELFGGSDEVELVKGRSCLSPVGNGQPRPCSAKAVSDITLLKVDRKRLDQLLNWSQSAEHLLVQLASERRFDEDTAWLNTVLRSNLFLKVPPVNVDGIFQYLSTLNVTAGEVIVREGEIGDRCYFIKEGEAEVARQCDGDKEILAHISAGRCFGEDALIQETVRNATVTMLSDGVLLVLQKSDFLSLLQTPEVPLTSWNEFRQAEEAGARPVLLDVRTDGEYGLGHLYGAASLPLHLLHLKHRLLDKSVSYLCYCNTGARSHTACHFLKQMGYEVRALSGGLSDPSAEELSEKLTCEDFLLSHGVVS